MFEAAVYGVALFLFLWAPSTFVYLLFPSAFFSLGWSRALSEWRWWRCGGGDRSDSVMSLSRWKGNCFKGDQTAESEAATSEREGSTPPREHLTPPPHPSILHTPPCSHLASSSCMPNAIAITAGFFFPVLLCPPPSSPPSKHHSAASSEITIAQGLGNLTKCRACM